MSTAHLQNRIPVRYGIALLAAALLSFAYAVLTAHVFAWLWAVVAIAVLGLALFVVYLGYRLVVAVERIAYEQ